MIHLDTEIIESPHTARGLFYRATGNRVPDSLCRPRIFLLPNRRGAAFQCNPSLYGTRMTVATTVNDR